MGSACASDDSLAIAACFFLVVPFTLCLDDRMLVRIIGIAFGIMYYGAGTVVMVTATDGVFFNLWITSVIALALLHGGAMVMLHRVYQLKPTHLGVLLAMGWPIFESIRFFVTKLVDTHGLRMLDLGLVVSNNVYFGQAVRLCGVPLLSLAVAGSAGCVAQACLPSQSPKSRVRDLAIAISIVVTGLVYGYAVRSAAPEPTRFAIAILSDEQITTKLVDDVNNEIVQCESKLKFGMRDRNHPENPIIVLFPEAAMHWYLNEPPDTSAATRQAALLRLSADENVLLCIGAGVHWDAKWCNACIMIRDGDLVDIVPKEHLVPILEKDFPMLERLLSSENRSLATPPQAFSNQVEGFRERQESNGSHDALPVVQPSICYDLFFQESYVTEEDGNAMYSCHIGPVSDKTNTLPSMTRKHARLRAIENRRPFIHVSGNGPCLVFSEIGEAIPAFREYGGLKSFLVPIGGGHYGHAGSYFLIPAACLSACVFFAILRNFNQLRTKVIQ